MMTRDAKGVKMNGYGPTTRTFMNGPDSVKALSSSKMSLQSLHSNVSSHSTSSGGGKLRTNGHISVSTHSLIEFEDKYIVLIMEPNDRWFGFSVFGGIDQDQSPKVNKISIDSSATRAGLQLSDEILEVNGNNVEQMTHADIMMQIHKCKTRITLKIRRYSIVNGSYENGDIHEMPVDVYPMPYNQNQNGIDYNNKNSMDRSPQTQMYREQPRIADRIVNRESNVPAKYYNEAFEDDTIDTSRESNIPSKFINAGFEGDDNEYVDVTPSRRIDYDQSGPKSLPLAKFITLLDDMQKKLIGQNQNELFHLHHLFSLPKFQAAVKTHNSMTKLQAAKKKMQIFKPVVSNSKFLLTEVRLTCMEMTDPTAEALLQLINKPHFHELLTAHDHIAKRENFNMDTVSLDEFSDSIDGEEAEETHYKIVRIDKSNDPLGATVRNEGDAVIISRIIKGGAAEKSGVLNEGDEIIEINDESVRGKNVNEVVELLAELEGTLTFVLLPSIVPQKEVLSDDIIVMKALFDYDPKNDEMLPCEELGLSFCKGDVLEILNQTDPDWWQARPLNSEDRPLAGLIPSKPYQRQREAAKITLKGEDTEPILKEKKLCLCGRGRRKGKKDASKKRNPPLQENEVLTYEDMVRRYPDPQKKRPIVLIGPQKVGRRELRKQLISEFPNLYASPVAHTTKSPSHDELSGLDYYFVTKAMFEKSIAAAEFIESGQVDGHFYGTSFKSVRDVINNGKTCILNISCSALAILRSSYLLPYVIFITLPPINSVKQLRELDDTCEPFNPSLRLKENEIDGIIEQARDINRSFGHYFDKTIVNSDFDQTYDKLREMCTKLESDPQWVPASWLPGG